MSSALLERLRHVLTEIDFLQRATASIDRDRFLADEMALRAFERSLTVIGEAVKALPFQLTERYPTVPWRRIAGMRDRLIHGYFSVDHDIVWDTAVNRVRELRPVVERMIADLEREAADG